MSYRKITVNDKQYEYVIGKVNTKIKGIGLFENKKIGDIESPRDDLGDSISDYDPNWREDAVYAVKPSTIRRLIEAAT